MLKAIQLILFIIITTIGYTILEGYAGCDFLYDPDCKTKPPYCPPGNEDCTVEGGVGILEGILNGVTTDLKFSEYAQNIVIYLLGFLTIIAVIYVMYAGFQVMTGGGDEEKTKKAKKIISYVAIGIAIIYLAYSFVTWIIETVIPATSETVRIEGKQNPNGWSFIPETFADDTYTENEKNTFLEYKNKIKVVLEEIEGELRINKEASQGKLQELKNLIQGAYERLPDSGEMGAENDTKKRMIDIEIALAMKSPKSSSIVGSTLGKVYTFLNSVKIYTITGDIVASPSEGNAPLTVSFRAKEVKDPSGTTPESNNYIWWMRGNGGKRTQLGQGASLQHTFTKDGTYNVMLDVVTSSRNSKGQIDVLPLSVSKQIEVKPKLGEIILLINGVNVSNISDLKISPNVGKMGVLFDATASKAIENGSITNTKWDFGNGKTLDYRGNPIVERQLYVNQGTYPIKVTLKTNTDVTFTKEINLVIRDPAAVIEASKTTGNIGEEMNFKSFSYFTSQNNVEYSWDIISNDNGKVIKSSVGPTLGFTFSKVGEYIVSLTSKSPNGEIDKDSKVITIESREPIINLGTPKPESDSKPNVFIFDASKSYDPDTMSRKGLTFTWRLDGEKVSLNDLDQDGSRGKLKFDKVGNHTIGLDVSNEFGKITSVEKTFEVKSILSVNLIITPNVAPIGTTINFIAQADTAGFYEWDLGDGSAQVNGSKRLITHVYNKTGTYTVKLKVKPKVGNTDGNSDNEISRTVYVTDTNSPFASINASNPSDSVYEDPKACSNSGAIIINRSEVTTLDAGNSINIDGSTAGLSYTWEYFDKVKTTEKLSQKFSDLGCFPIKLTVRSNNNGSNHTTTKYLSIRNEKPEFTSITATVDATKKDAQKVLVKVTANGARDPDGVITSYIWFYTTDSDKEPQNIQITQKNEITFVLPNITEKYYFGVILEDNDGGRKNSIDDSADQSPLLIDNQDGNIYLPLISLSGPKLGLAGEKIRFSVEAKTIVGTNITNKAEYAWDFDGDGRIDEKTTNSVIDHVYKASGSYTLKVRVTNNGVSNTKYQTITIKNPLKAGFQGYSLPNGDVYLLNTSKGPYEKVLWNIGGEVTESLYSLKIKNPETSPGGDFGTLTISTIEGDSDVLSLNTKDIGTLQGDGVKFQTFPSSIDNIIHVSGPGEKVLISLIGNEGTRFAIDDDMSIDSDLDGVVDNDEDNKELPSYTDGSVYSLQNFSTVGNRNRQIKLSVYNSDILVNSVTLTLVFDYIKEPIVVSGEDLGKLDSEKLNSFDEAELNNLAGLIRKTDDTSRIILMQLYNLLIENWDDPFAKAKTLIDIQEKVNELNLSSSLRDSFSKSIDTLLVGDSTSTDEITIATKIIEGLIPESSKDRTTILEKLNAIKSHPQLLAENKNIALEILKLVESDTVIETKYKLHIKNQLQLIVNGGQGEVAPPEKEEPTQSGGIIGFIIGVFKVLGLIILIMLGIVGIGYIFYRVTRKNTDIGFQDFVIDSVFHTKGKSSISTDKKYDPIEIKETPKTVTTDPLVASYNPPPVLDSDPLNAINQNNTSSNNVSYYNGGNISQTDPLSNSDALVPDWLKVQKSNINITESLPNENEIEDIKPEEGNITQPEVIEPISENNEVTLPVDEYVVPDENTMPQSKEENPEDVLLIKDSNDSFISEINQGDNSVKNDNSFIVTPETISNDSNPIESKLVQPPPMERDENMPDWLSIDPMQKPIMEGGEEGAPPIDTPQIEIEQSQIKNGDTSDALPDWLVQSVGGSNKDTLEESQGITSSDDSSNNESLLNILDDSSTETEIIPKKTGSQKKPKGPKSPETRKPEQHDNIPDWLK